MIRADILWRERKGFNLPDNYRSPKDIIECDVAQVYKFFPTWVQGDIIFCINNFITTDKCVMRNAHYPYK